MKKIWSFFAVIVLAMTFMSCGGVKLADTTWKSSDDWFDYELTFTKKEMTYTQTSKYGEEYDKEPMTVKYSVEGNVVYGISNYDGSKSAFTTIDGNTMTFSDEYETIVFTKVEEE